MDGTSDNGLPLSALACPNPDGDAFNPFGAGNLSVAERMGKNKAIRRLYCRTCGHRFSERQGSLLQDVTTAHIERVNGTIRCQQGRLARRTRTGSRLERALGWSLWLWRDLYNWTRVHASLLGRTPAMVLELAQDVWSVRRYVLHPVHVSHLQQEIWAEERQEWLTSALDRLKPKGSLPTS